MLISQALTIKKMLKMVLLYPFTLLIFLIILACLVERLIRVPLSKLRVLCFACLYLCCTPLAANLSILLLQSKINYQHCAPDINHTIILAGGTSRMTAEKSDWSALGDVSISRTVFLASRLDQLGSPSVIISGGAGRGVKEAELMGDLLRRLDPQRNPDIILDLDAKNTEESAGFVRREMPDENLGYYLVTSDWHMARAQAIFEHKGIKVCPLASGESYVPYGFPGWFIPQKSALAKFELAWHEFGGLLLLWWANL